MTPATTRRIEVHEHRGAALAQFLPRAEAYMAQSGIAPPR